VNLEEKIGQLFMFGFAGREVTPGLAEFTARLRPAGFIYFGRNIRDPAQTRQLSGDLGALAQRLGMPPLLIAADQEGGPVLRLRQGATPIPPAMGLGASGDAGLVEAAAHLAARELLAVGINMNLAPVLDVNNNPANPVIGIRSLGGDPAEVARLGVAAVRGCQRAGVLATAKHFPGHGDTHLDSHHHLPTIGHQRSRLSQVELVPFQAAVGAGVEAVMTAHIVYPELEPGLPATISAAVIQGLLRGELGFDGLVVTDCMEMAAIQDGWGTARASLLAIKAGADLVLISHQPALQEAAFQAVLQAAYAGELPLSQIDASVHRVLRAKARRSAPWPDLNSVGGRDSLHWAKEAFARTITLVRAGPGFPLPGEVLVTVADAKKPTQVEDPARASLARALARHLPVREVRLDELENWPPQLPVVIGTANIQPASELAGRILSAARTRPTVVVAMHSPYDLLALPSIETYLCTYSQQELALEAAADVMAGKARPPGALPVELPGLYPPAAR
jgi:beta-N-acetylhexosaminidase